MIAKIKANEWYPKIKKWYDDGLWPKSAVANAVVKAKITAAQYEQITGEVYVAPTD